MTEPIRPASPGSDTIKTTGTSPADLNPSLRELEMMEDLLFLLDPPSDITKPFAVRKAIYTALNHTPENPTGYDTSARIRLYSIYERSSLNVGAKLFDTFTAFLMKPHVMIQGMPTGNTVPQEPGFFGRILNRITGGGKTQQAQSAGAQ